MRNVLNQTTMPALSRRGLDITETFGRQAAAQRKALNNIYHVIVVDSEKHSEVNVNCARNFAAFMIAEDTQTTIGEFGVEEFGEPLFIRDAGNDVATGTPAP